MTYYAGLDVSLRTVNICVIDDEGKLVAEAKLASDVQDIVAYLDELNLNISSIALEAGTLTQYMTYGLQSADFEVICMEARQVKAALSAMRNKTDKHDARGIAQLLRSGWYSQVHVKSIESHHIRMLLSSRRAVLSKHPLCFKARPQAWLSILSDQCLHAAGLKPVPTAKRSVTHAKTRPEECHNKLGSLTFMPD